MTIMDTEVIVVGFGISGLTAALSALDAGARVVVLEKGTKNNARGFDCGAVNSSVHKEAGVIIDRDALIGELMVQSNYRADQRLFTVWTDKSGEMIDWLRGLVEPRGIQAFLPEHRVNNQGPYKVWQTAVNWTGQNAGLAKEMEALIVEKGGEIHYKTPAVQLMREPEGRVTGVIARQPDGSLLHVNAKKGVILSCGGYDDNPEMMEKYLRPADLRVARHNSETGGCVGDGHTMALAVGAEHAYAVEGTPTDCVRAGQMLATIESNLSLSTYSVAAPISGVVVERSASVGGLAGEGAPLFEIADLSQLWVDLHIFGADAQHIQPGVPVAVTRMSDGETVRTTLERVLPGMATASQSTVARATIDNADNQWRPGTAVKARITVAQEPVDLMVPLTALQSMDGQEAVFVREGETYLTRHVELGARDATQVQILSGLSEGEEVVVAESYLIKADIGKEGAAHDH